MAGTSTSPRLRISAQIYHEDEPTGQLEALGVISLKNGRLTQRPKPGKAAQLAQFIKNYRAFGVGLEQSDEEFLAHLPQRVSWRDGAVEQV